MCIISQFGYSPHLNDLSIRDNFVYPKTFSVQDTDCCELTHEGLEFVRTRLFHRYAKSDSGALSARDLDKMFSLALPAENPFAAQLACVRLLDDQRVPLASFLALWQLVHFSLVIILLLLFIYLSLFFFIMFLTGLWGCRMLVFTDHRLAMRLLATLGFEGSVATAIAKFSRYTFIKFAFIHSITHSLTSRLMWGL